MFPYKTEKLTPRQVSLIAGLSIVLMAICAGFSYGFVHASLILKDNPTETLNRISQSLNLFQMEIIGWFIILLLDVVVSWALYVFLKKLGNPLALIVPGLRLLYASILGIALAHLIAIALLIDKGNQGLSISIESLENQLVYHLNSFDRIWSLGLILFGFHLLALSYGILKSNFIPKILGLLVGIASLSYILVHSLRSFLPQLETVTLTLESLLSLPMALGELTLALWLILRGGRNSS